jgi:hypothetical protein
LGGPAVRAEGGGLGDFLSHLFGVPQAKAPDAAAHRPHKPRVRDFVPATTTREPGTLGGAPVQPTFFIDVVGDSLGVLTTGGLTEALAMAGQARELGFPVSDTHYTGDESREARGLADSIEGTVGSVEETIVRPLILLTLWLGYDRFH